jgi:hypothetical protein
MSNPLTRTLNLSINLSLCSSGHSRSTRLDRSQTTNTIISSVVEPNHDSGLSENIKATQPSIQNLLPKCGDDDPSPVAAAQLKLNTRINASGSVSSTVTSPTMLSLQKSDSKTLRDDQNTSTSSFQLRKRPLSEEDVRQMCSKETRGLHTPLCSELFNRYDTNAALFHEMTTDCVSQSVTLTPCLESKDTQQKLSEGLYLSRTLLTDEKKACTLSNEEHSAITQSKKRSKRVKFSNEIPSFIYPLTITPDE